MQNPVSELTKNESPRDHSFNHASKFTNSGHRAIVPLFTLRWQSPHWQQQGRHDGTLWTDYSNHGQRGGQSLSNCVTEILTPLCFNVQLAVFCANTTTDSSDGKGNADLSPDPTED